MKQKAARSLWFILFLLSFSAPIVAQAKHSIMPVAGYSPTYNVFFGGAYVYSDESLDWTNIGLLTTAGIFQLESNIAVLDSDSLPTLEFMNLFARGFEPFYRDDLPDFPAKVFGNKYRLIVKYNIYLDENWSVVPSTQFRHWKTNYEKTDGRYSDLIANENTPAVGVALRWESNRKRKPWESGRELELIQTLGFKLPSSFYQYEINAKNYQALFEKVLLATKVRIARSLGTPTFRYAYTLGGTDELRGFLKNRFIGENVYIVQNELRVDIYKGIGAAFFGELGNTSNGKQFRTPEFSYGAGLRYALPPDRLTYARVDFGIGDGQQGIFVDVGHAF